MPTLSDERFDALRAQGFTGATSDMLLQWLQTNGDPAAAIPDAWKAMLLLQTGLPEENYQRNDYWYQLLGDLGYEGSLNDREMAFWEDGGVLSTDGVKIITQPDQVCYNEGLHTYTVVAESGNGSALTYQWQEFVEPPVGPFINADTPGVFANRIVLGDTFNLSFDFVRNEPSAALPEHYFMGGDVNGAGYSSSITLRPNGSSEENTSLFQTTLGDVRLVDLFLGVPFDGSTVVNVSYVVTPAGITASIDGGAPVTAATAPPSMEFTDIQSALGGGGFIHGGMFNVVLEDVTNGITYTWPIDEGAGLTSIETTSGTNNDITWSADNWSGVTPAAAPEWTDIPGATSATYAPVLTYPEKDGVQIRCVVSNDTNSRNSAAVTICYTGITIGIITEDGLDDTFSEDGTTEIIEDRF